MKPDNVHKCKEPQRLIRKDNELDNHANALKEILLRNGEYKAKLKAILNR